MAQHKFGTRRRAMLSFERQPFPAPCHVDQDVAHSRAWCALRHLTTFNRVLSALHRRNHLPVPPDLHPANAATGITVWSVSFAPGVHFETNSDLCATAYLRPLHSRRPEVAIACLPSTPIGRAAAQEVWSIQNNSGPTIGLAGRSYGRLSVRQPAEGGSPMSGMGRREFVALLGGVAGRGRSRRARSSHQRQSCAKT